MKFILGKKLEMSQIFSDSGEVIPVTLVQAGPCQITQIKNKAGKDGYSAVQIGFDKKKKLNIALRGHLKELGNLHWLREFRIKNEDLLKDLKRGDKITADIFSAGDKIKMIGTSKGKGFQGVVKRHGFHGHPKTHGHKDQERMPGSIGAGGMQRVIKGMRMPGHMGAERITVKNLEVVKIDSDKNLLYIKGAVPGTRGSLVEIVGEGELKINKEKSQKEKSEKILEKVEVKEKESERVEDKKEEIKEIVK